MQGSVCSKVAVKGSPTKNGEKRGKTKSPWKTESYESSSDENGKIGIHNRFRKNSKIKQKF